FGGMADFRPPPNRRTPAQRCALLAQVSFDDAPGDPPLTLLLLRPALVDGMPSDLLDYAIRSPRFPHESTGDQFFDEEQWESYRALGRLIGDRVFASAGGAGAWLPRRLAPLPPG